jgi:sarcosine oxidase, subunit beta
VRTGMLWGADPVDREMLEANVALGHAEGVATEVLDGDDVAAIDSRIVLDDLVFCWEADAGFCDPYAVTAGFAAAARRLGAEVREGVGAKRVEPGGVETERGFIAAGAVVVAAGAWTPPLLVPHGYEVEIRAARAQVGRLRLPDDFGPPPPTVGDFSAAQLYFRPGESGYLEVGSLDPRHADDPVDPDDVAEGADRATLAHYHRSLARRLRGAERGVWRGAWSGIYDVTPDWEPVIGGVPGADGLYVAAGFSGHGFKLAPAVGLSLAELVLDGAVSSFDLSLLDPLRFDRGDLVGARYGYSVLG